MDWKMCSHEMPEALKTVYVTIRYNGDDSRYTDVMWYSEKNQRWYKEASGTSVEKDGSKDFTVIAWMDRPQPYRGAWE